MRRCLWLQELHHRYYEPLCQEVASLDLLLAGPPVKKLLLMADPETISSQHQPHWEVLIRRPFSPSSSTPAEFMLLLISDHFPYRASSQDGICGCIGNLTLLWQVSPESLFTGGTEGFRFKSRSGILVQAAVRADFKGADITMAVPNMLEILPRGINKWVGMQLLLQDLKVCLAC